jgi:ADP-heptose:LPS heptosyltransferase
MDFDPTANLPLSTKIRLRRRNIEHWMRDRLLALFQKGVKKKQGEIDFKKVRESVRRIVIVRTGKALGDAVMATVLLEECRRIFPVEKLDFLVRENIASLFQDAASVDEVKVFYPKFLKNMGGFLSAIRSLRKARYDLVILCDPPTKSSFTALCLGVWTGAPYLLGFDNEESRGVINMPIVPAANAPMVQNLLKLLSPFGEVSGDRLPVLKPSSSSSVKAEDELKKMTSPRSESVLIFIPHHWRKSSPLEDFLKIGSVLSDAGYSVLLSFGPGDERAESHEVMRCVQRSNGQMTVLLPRPLPVFAAVIQRCRLFISNDCGPYHVAAALGVPALGIFLTPEAMRDFGYQSERCVSVLADDGQRIIDRVVQESMKLLN